jgi:hypothetical protein
VGTAVLEHRRSFESNLEVQLEMWKADIDVLKAEARDAGLDSVVHDSRFIDELQGKHDKVSYYLSSLRGASDAAWEGLRSRSEADFMAFTARKH